ncbi:MAG: hypothetical protein EHM75_04685 [Desulfobacteraceae bacterium]|nr:MAG: hypothetical protein EHM75_04685 [Desulfobacteraceae bacterium]
MKYVFGPVPSRRLGFSLGVDLLPYKTCSFDCIYCELGPTTCRTLEPKDLFPPEAVLAELDDFLATTVQEIDYLTISGSGEPTLHPELGLPDPDDQKKIRPTPGLDHQRVPFF